MAGLSASRRRRLLGLAIDANTRLVIALGEPQPGNRDDTIMYHSSGINQQLAGREVMADGGYRGNREVIMPYRKPRDGGELPEWKQDYNAGHRKVRARVEHALARLKTYKILRDYRRAARTLARHSIRNRPPAQHRSDRLTKTDAGQRPPRVTRHHLDSADRNPAHQSWSVELRDEDVHLVVRVALHQSVAEGLIRDEPAAGRDRRGPAATARAGRRN